MRPPRAKADAFEHGLALRRMRGNGRKRMEQPFIENNFVCEVQFSERGAMRQAGIVVVGAGLAGAASAYALARRGAGVTLIDRAEGAGQGASFANAGMLTPSMSDPWNAPGVWRDLLRWLGREDAPMLLRLRALPGLSLWGLQFLANSSRSAFERAIALNVRLGLFSIETMDAWRKEAAFDYDGACAGTMKIYRSEAAWREGVAKAETMAQLGVAFRGLDRDAMLAFEPALAPIADELAGAVHFPNDQSGDANKFAVGLSEASAARGVVCRWGETVRRLRLDGGAVTGVVLASGETIPADAVVLATGAYAPALAAQAGVRLPIRPVKGYSITYPAEGLTLPRLPIVDDVLHAALTPLGSRVRVAGTAEFTGFDDRLQPRRIDNLRGLLRQVLPAQAEELERRGGAAWTGFRPMHARGAPAIGRTARPGLYVNAGHGHLGWTLAAGSGEALARLMLGADDSFDLTPFEPRAA